MNKSIYIVLIVLFITCITDITTANEPAIQAGTAWTDITPPLGCPLWGYDARKEGADGAIDPLLAKILILKSADTTIALVSWDVCEFQSPWLRDHIGELGIDELLLLNSHTHSGPNLFLDDFPSKEKPWKRTIEERILAAIEEAQKNLQPVYIAAGYGSIQLAYNRLRRDPDGLATTIFLNLDHLPIGPVDPTVGVIRMTDEKGAVRVVMVSYACHPVSLGSSNLKISTDYVGPMYRKVEKELGGNAVCMFVQGCGGDMNPLYQARKVNDGEDRAQTERMGELLAGEVLQTLELMKDKTGLSGQLHASTKTIQVKHRWEPDKTLTFGTTAVLINDDIGIVTLPGEPFHKFQIDVRELSSLPHTFLFGYCDNCYQDWPNWYLPDIASAARGGYGASDSGIPEVGTGERLCNEGVIQLYTLRGMLKSEPQPGRRP